MASNIQSLGDTLSGRMKKTAGAAVPTTIELGTINGNLSLSTDSLMTPIPKGEYMIDIRLKSKTYRTSADAHTHNEGGHGGHRGGEDGTHTHSGGSHNHLLPEDFRSVSPGDRVLVAWCGNDAVVIAIVTGS